MLFKWQLKKYSITPAEYSYMYSWQNEVCAICEKPETNKQYHRLSVDHCHKTSKIRGLLCGHCNTAIGKFLDSPRLLRKAANYLEKGQW